MTRTRGWTTGQRGSGRTCRGRTNQPGHLNVTRATKGAANVDVELAHAHTAARTTSPPHQRYPSQARFRRECKAVQGRGSPRSCAPTANADNGKRSGHSYRHIRVPPSCTAAHGVAVTYLIGVTVRAGGPMFGLAAGAVVLVAGASRAIDARTLETGAGRKK